MLFDDVEVLVPRVGNSAGGRAFAQLGAPGGPGCCLWCGARLGAPKLKTEQVAGARGAYGDNSFCGLSCGYQFGLDLACRGRRLYVRPSDLGAVSNKAAS